MTKLTDRFDAWHAGNPEFYEQFCFFADEALKAGRNKISAWLIANRIRWEATLSTSGERYRVPNDFIALFARKYMDEHPARGDVFDTRPMLRA